MSGVAAAAIMDLKARPGFAPWRGYGESQRKRVAASMTKMSGTKLLGKADRRRSMTG